MRKPTITFWRRLSQMICFVLLVYSGFIFAGNSKSNKNEVLTKTGENTPFRKGVLFTEGMVPILNLYPPGAVCFFVWKKGFVKGCNVYLISDALARQTSLSIVLPAVLVFIVLSFIFGRLWCGWVCPLGAFGDLIDAARRRLKFHHTKYGEGTKKGLRSLSYDVFFLTAGISLLIGHKQFNWLQKYLYLPFCEICPARLMCPVVAGASPSFAGSFATPAHCIFTVLMYGTLAFFITGFMVARRMWCHFCPIGLATSWFNRGGLLELRKDVLRCNRCGICVEGCPMNCTHIRDEKTTVLLNHSDCIFCMRCIELCPKEKCLHLNFIGLRLIEAWLRPMKK